MKDPDMIKLKRSNVMNFRVQLESEFNDFFSLYPTLFKIVCDGSDLTRLAEMLYMIDEMKKGGITKDSAEKELGESLAGEYLYPNLPK
jgi:hypothetical protein